MQLASEEFLLIFLPCAFAGFLLLRRSLGRTVSVVWLVACSLALYGWTDPRLAAGLAVSIGVHHALVGQIAQRSGARAGKILLILGIAANLLVLGWLKYLPFLADTLRSLIGVAMEVGRSAPPVGISFIAFLQIAYLVDAYAGRTTRRGLLDDALFISFFPKLAAGPIAYQAELAPQLDEEPSGRRRLRDASVGLAFLAAGLFKKTVLAALVARFADDVFGAAEAGRSPTFAAAHVAALAYTLQIYFDFSGYSDMAVGAARLFGFRLPLNFNSPYKASSIADFWRRWHITLSRFIRDHIYIPLGGSRRGEARRYANLLLTMLLCGLWHGAGWTFVLWGGLHGACLSLHHAWTRVAARLGLARRGEAAWWRGIAIALTFGSVVAGWVLFRARTLDAAGRMLASMAGWNGLDLSLPFSRAESLATIGLMLAIVWALPNTQEWLGRYVAHAQTGRYVVRRRIGSGALRRLAWRPTLFWAVCCAALLAAGYVGLSGAAEFIYYRF